MLLTVYWFPSCHFWISQRIKDEAKKTTEKNLWGTALCSGSIVKFVTMWSLFRFCFLTFCCMEWMQYIALKWIYRLLFCCWCRSALSVCAILCTVTRWGGGEESVYLVICCFGAAESLFLKWFCLLNHHYGVIECVYCWWCVCLQMRLCGPHPYSLLSLSN